MNDMKGIMEAQTARGVEFDAGGIVRKVRLMVPLCVPLLVSSVRKTNSAAIAAEVRGFNLRTASSGYKEYPSSPSTWRRWRLRSRWSCARWRWGSCCRGAGAGVSRRTASRASS